MIKFTRRETEFQISKREYVGVFIGFFFTIGGIITVFIKGIQNPKTLEISIPVTLFCAAYFFMVLDHVLYKREQQKLSKNNEKDIYLPLETPIALNKRFYILTAILFITIGATGWQLIKIFNIKNNEILAKIIISAIFVFGVGQLFATALGLAANSSFSFRPQGILFCYRTYSFLVEWNNIENYQSIDYAGAPIFVIDVVSTDALEKTLESNNKEIAQKKLSRHIRWNFQACSSHIALGLKHYRINAVDLQKTIEFCLEQYNKKNNQSF